MLCLIVVIVANTCCVTVPGLWPSMLGHGPQQLPHARLTPALYAALPVLEELPHLRCSVKLLDWERWTGVYEMFKRASGEKKIRWSFTWTYWIAERIINQGIWSVSFCRTWPWVCRAGKRRPGITGLGEKTRFFNFFEFLKHKIFHKTVKQKFVWWRMSYNGKVKIVFDSKTLFPYTKKKRKCYTFYASMCNL